MSVGGFDGSMAFLALTQNVKNKPGGGGCDVLLSPTSAAKTVIYYAAHRGKIMISPTLPPTLDITSPDSTVWRRMIES